MLLMVQNILWNIFVWPFTVFTKWPFVEPLCWFSRDVHRRALPKFVSLWVFSILPLVFAAFLAQKTANETMFQAFVKSIQNEFTTKSLFIYAVSFLVPLIYLVYERSIELAGHAYAGTRAPPNKQMADGFRLVLFTSVLVFLFSTFAYGHDSSAKVLLDYLMALGAVYIVYAFSMYCWYLTLLTEIFSSSTSDYVQTVRSEEVTFTGDLANRLGGKPDGTE